MAFLIIEVFFSFFSCGTRIRDANLKKKHDTFANLFVCEKKFMANESWLFCNFPTLLWICLEKEKKIKIHAFKHILANFWFSVPYSPPPPLPPSKMHLEAKPTCLVVRKRSRSSKDWFSHISLALFRIQRTLGSHTVINDYSLPLWPAHYEQTSELPKINSSLLTLNCLLLY